MARIPKRALLVAVCLVAVALGSCRSGSGDPPMVGASARASGVPQPSVAPPSLDALFRGYRTKLPPAETLGEENGASLICDHHDAVTYSLLAAVARKLPIRTNEDVVRLASWARDRDVCLRQIALEAIVHKVGFHANRLVVPSMHEKDHYLY